MSIASIQMTYEHLGCLDSEDDAETSAFYRRLAQDTARFGVLELQVMAGVGNRDDACARHVRRQARAIGSAVREIGRTPQDENHRRGIVVDGPDHLIGEDLPSVALMRRCLVRSHGRICSSRES